MNEEVKEKIEEAKEKEGKKTQVDSAASSRKINCTGAIITALFSGVAIGFVVGILLAPKKGEEIRKEIKDKSSELIDLSKKTISDTVDKTKEFTKESASKFEKIKKIIVPKKKPKKTKIEKEVDQYIQ